MTTSFFRLDARRMSIDHRSFESLTKPTCFGKDIARLQGKPGRLTMIRVVVVVCTVIVRGLKVHTGTSM